MADGTQSRPHPVLVGLATLGILALAGIAAVLIAFFLALRSVPDFAHLASQDIHDQTFLSDLAASKAVGGIKLNGAITNEMAEVVIKKLEEARDDSRIVAVLLDVNSPGGSVVPSQEIYDLVKQVREKKPVVTYVHDMAASGAYYASSSSTKIIANRGSLIGSIGVVLQTVESTELMKWLKLHPVTLKTGKLKDAGSPLRPWTEDDKAYLQKLIDDTRAQFVKDVAIERKLSDATLAHLSDGRVVLGTDALEHKLIDGLGSKSDALMEIATLLGVPDAPKLYYLEESKNLRFFLSDFVEGLHEVNRLTRLLTSGTPSM